MIPVKRTFHLSRDFFDVEGMIPQILYDMILPITDPWNWYTYLQLPEKSTIHVGIFCHTWILYGLEKKRCTCVIYLKFYIGIPNPQKRVGIKAQPLTTMVNKYYDIDDQFVCWTTLAA